MQLRPTDYALVVDSNPQAMAEKVNQLLREGYVPHGDTKAVALASQIGYSQPMVKIEPVAVNMPGMGDGSILVPR